MEILNQFAGQQFYNFQFSTSKGSTLGEEEDMERIGDYIPAIVRLQDLKTMTNVYTNKMGCHFFNRSREELLTMGREYYRCFFAMEEVLVIKSHYEQLLKEVNTEKTYSFFQRIRPNNESDYLWFFTHSRLYRSPKVPDALNILYISIRISEMSYMGKRLDHLMEEQAFIYDHYTRFKDLSNREKEIVRLIANGLCSKRIAESLYISIHTVNNHRKNIIQKIGTKDLSVLMRYVTYFDSVYP